MAILQILDELRARIRPDESTPPAYDCGWWNWTEHTPSAEYPRVTRRRWRTLVPGRDDASLEHAVPHRDPRGEP